MLYRHIAFIMLFWWPTFGGDTEESLQSALAFKWADPKISNVRVYQMVKGARKKRLDFQDSKPLTNFTLQKKQISSKFPFFLSDHVVL